MVNEFKGLGFMFRRWFIFLMDSFRGRNILFYILFVIGLIEGLVDKILMVKMCFFFKLYNVYI